MNKYQWNPGERQLALWIISFAVVVCTLIIFVALATIFELPGWLLLLLFALFFSMVRWGLHRFKRAWFRRQ